MEWRLLVCVLLVGILQGNASVLNRPDDKTQHIGDVVQKLQRGRQKRQVLHPECNGGTAYLTAPVEITTPSFPLQYSNNVVCRWRISVSNGQPLSLQFLAFDVEYGNIQCPYDSLKVYEEISGVQSLKATLCGNSQQNPISTSGSVFILQFTSDSSVVRQGFKIQVQTGTMAGPDCGTTSDITTDIVTIKSPTSSPTRSLSYPNNKVCTWQVRASIREKIKLTNLATKPFQLETSIGCIYDYLLVSDGYNADSGVLGRYCGNTFPPSGITSTTNRMYIKFSSDSSVTSTGFELSLEFVKSVICGGALSGPPGEFHSPGFGVSNYPNNAECTWTIQVESEKVVRLQFNSFTLESHSRCQYDVVTIYDGASTTSPEIGFFCGSSIPTAKQSHDNTMTVTFSSDGSVTKSGFSATYTALSADTGGSGNPACGASRPMTLTGASGEITSPGYTDNSDYPNNARCQWVITVLTGKRVNLHSNVFDVESESSCSRDAMKVYDGPDDTSDTLGVYCGSTVLLDISSTSNVMMIQFRSDGSTMKRGFNITYSTIDPPGPEPACGMPVIAPDVGLIVGGTEAIAHSWPWQITLHYQNGHYCGGSIVSSRWIVTAAHCVNGRLLRDYYVIVGKHDRTLIESTERRLPIAMIIVHEEYAGTTDDNDIALLKMANNIPFSSAVSSVCLSTTDAANETNCYTTGWGNTQSTGSNLVLRQVLVPIIARQTCSLADWYGASITENMICAGYAAGDKDSCQGDSGGPLVCLDNEKYQLQGITSWGYGCAEPKKPGVYTRVSRYINWISNMTGGAFQAAP